MRKTVQDFSVTRRPLLGIFSLVLVAFAGLFMSPVAAHADAGGPTLIKRTIRVTLKRFLRYWKSPTAAEPVYNTWSWAPSTRFQVLGPVAAGSQFSVEYELPSGKPWMEQKCETPTTADGDLAKISTPDEDESIAEKRAILQTGAFPFKIKFKNGPAGVSSVIFSGVYKVETYALPANIPEYKNKQEFVISQDWNLPIGYLWIDPTADLDLDEKPLTAGMWFRGPADDADLRATVYFKGAPVGNPKEGSSEDEEVTTGVGDAAHHWTLRRFTFGAIRDHHNADNTNANTTLFYLDKNPGDYQIKVLENGKLVRTADFRVGEDGKLVDNGIANQNKIGGIRMVLPVKVLGTLDHNPDLTAWKTDALYGHPLAGFTAP